MNIVNELMLLGLSIRDIKVGIKTFRGCESFRKGSIRDEDCAKCVRQAIELIFGCDFPDAINLAIRDIIDVRWSTSGYGLSHIPERTFYLPHQCL